MCEIRFLEYLIHKWDNIQQAQMNPSTFAHVHYDWSIHDKTLYSKQWYDWNGKVYRERSHILETHETYIKMNICENGLYLIFTEDETGNGYIGKTPENCYNNDGIKIETVITLDCKTYTSYF